MPYTQPILYRYRLFPLFRGIALLCISVTPEAEAPLEGDTVLWANLIANAVKKHGDALTLGILKVGSQTYMPEPVLDSMKVIWNSYKNFANDRPAEDEENWPVDSDTATR